MKIQIASDLHLEHGRTQQLTNAGDADILILAGDIIVAKALENVSYKQWMMEYFGHLNGAFENVVVIPGNHEYYGSELTEAERVLTQFYGGFQNIHYLNNTSINIGGFEIFGSPLWSNMDGESPVFMNFITPKIGDFSAIRKGHTPLRPAHMLDMHKDSLVALETFYNDCEHIPVIVTHFPPSCQSLHDRFRGDAMNPYFMNNMDVVVEAMDRCPLWIHGHVHDVFDYTINKTRVVANPHGYAQLGENWSFDPKKVIEL